MLVLSIAVAFAGLTYVLSATASTSKSAVYEDPDDNRGKTPFFLQDPYDQMCLGPYGFTVCDENALWQITPRKGLATYSMVSLTIPSSKGICLERKSSFFGLFPSDKLGLGNCNKPGSKSWKFDFVDQTHAKLSVGDKCLVRGKRQYKNSFSMQSCAKGEFLPLIYHPTAVHENGFFLKAADDFCFDGEKFRSCEGKGYNQLLWGIGVRFVWGEAKRYLFSYNLADREKCLVSKGKKVMKGKCSESGSLDWNVYNGALSTQKGQKCLARKVDNTGVMVPCKEASEFIAIDVPMMPTSEEMTKMLKNPDLTSEEKGLLADTIRKRSGLSS